MAKYEILYIIRPNIEEEAKNALADHSKKSEIYSCYLLGNLV